MWIISWFPLWRQHPPTPRFPLVPRLSRQHSRRQRSWCYHFLSKRLGVVRQVSLDKWVSLVFFCLEKCCFKNISPKQSLKLSIETWTVFKQRTCSKLTFLQKKHALAINTVSGRNPAPPGMYKTLYMMGFQLPTSTGAGFLKPSTVGKEFI